MVDVELLLIVGPDYFRRTMVANVEIEIALDEPVAAITPGQSIVLYEGTKVLGGGFIESAVPPERVRALPILAA